MNLDTNTRDRSVIARVNCQDVMFKLWDKPVSLNNDINQEHAVDVSCNSTIQLSRKLKVCLYDSVMKVSDCHPAIKSQGILEITEWACSSVRNTS